MRRRRDAGLLARCAAEATDAYRVLHGSAEGWPGVSVDVYGGRTLVQSWRRPLDAAERADVCAALGASLPHAAHDVRFHLRGAAARAAEEDEASLKEGDDEGATFSECGVQYSWVEPRRGGDPSLFLDLRYVRRAVRERAAGADVLNLFAYTCGVGVAAAVGGASSVLNVDHSRRYLDTGVANGRLNGVEQETLAQDFFPAARQLAGLPVKGRAVRRGRKFEKLAPRDFDVCVLDPPTKTKTPFGMVDIVNDYAALAKPALLCVRPGGVLLATNHAPAVDPDAWVDSVVRCAAKAGRRVASAALLEPEPDDVDFPAVPGAPPLLKVAAFTMA